MGARERHLTLAYKRGKLTRLPVFDKLRENGPRQGFFERHQYEAVRRHLPSDLQLAVAIAYTFGWRIIHEVLALERRHVDLKEGSLRLDPGSTKNDDGRVVYLTPELKDAMTAHVGRVDALQRRIGRIIPFLFPHFGGRGRQGTQRRDFKKAWATACRAAGCPGMLRHDFRRTAVRNMVNAGIPERVAMTITGHRTRRVFDAYHIVAPEDLREAARKLSALAPGTVPGTVRGSPLDSHPASV